MTLFRAPEVATRYGAIDDEAAADGEPWDAHDARELSRSANRQILRGGLMYAKAWRADTSGEIPGAALAYADASWAHMLPEGSAPVPKKSGLTAARLRIRADITSGALVRFALATHARPDPDNRPSAEYLDAVGTGSDANYTKNDCIVQRGPGERIALVARAILDLTETALPTGTYGSAANGTVDTATRDSFTDSSSTWNTSAPLIHEDGYYVVFWDTSSRDRVVYGPVRLIATDATSTLRFWPPHPHDQAWALRGTHYEIRKLPDLQLRAVSLYSVDGTP